MHLQLGESVDQLGTRGPACREEGGNDDDFTLEDVAIKATGLPCWSIRGTSVKYAERATRRSPTVRACLEQPLPACRPVSSHGCVASALGGASHQHEWRMLRLVRREHAQRLEHAVHVLFRTGQQRPAPGNANCWPQAFSRAGVSVTGSTLMETRLTSRPSRLRADAELPMLTPIGGQTPLQVVKMKFMTRSLPGARCARLTGRPS